MEEIDLTASDYWEGPGVDIRLNPRLDFETGGLRDFVESDLGIESAVVFATSGSTGSGPKFVILEKQAILASAEAVNRHLEVSKDDRWLCALTTFHVGGLGVWARAWKAGCPVFGMNGERWDKTGRAFAEVCREHEITLTALTPTHLHDVVASGHTAPGSLRATLIGGAALDDSLLREAVDLGWPILRTYGMTEAASQIATDELNAAYHSERAEALPVLPNWETRTDEGRLAIYGPALFHGYAIRNPERGNWELSRPFSGDGFFTTSDRVELPELKCGKEGVICRGRADDQVKKLGEIVALDRLRARLRRHFPKIPATIVARPHERMGQELVAVIEGTDVERCRTTIKAFNALVAPFERIDRFGLIETMPETGIGKVAHGRLVELHLGGRMPLLPVESRTDNRG